MIHELSENRLQSALDDFVLEKNQETIKLPGHLEGYRYSIRDFLIDESDFQT
jgi:hypothetical protein